MALIEQARDGALLDIQQPLTSRVLVPPIATTTVSAGVSVGANFNVGPTIRAGVGVGANFTVSTGSGGPLVAGVLVGSSFTSDSGDLAGGRYRR